MTEPAKHLVQEQEGEEQQQELELWLAVVEEKSESVCKDPMTVKVERQLDTEEENTHVLARKASSADRHMAMALRTEQS
jgi:hypothetical protein